MGRVVDICFSVALSTAVTKVREVKLALCLLIFSLIVYVARWLTFENTACIVSFGEWPKMGRKQGENIFLP